MRESINRFVTTLILTSLFSVSANAAEPSTRPSSDDVQQKLRAVTETYRKQSPEAVKTFDADVAIVAASGIAENAPKVGDKAEDFELPGANGKVVRLTDLLKKGPVVMTWYRGGWCPYCNIALHSMVDAEPTIRALGATLVAITPETPDHAADTIKKDEIPFNVLSDKGNQVADKYRIAYRLPTNTSTAMKTYGVDLTKQNGDASDRLPLPATFIIDTDRTIFWRFVDADYRTRAEPNDVISALKQLRSTKMKFGYTILYVKDVEQTLAFYEKAFKLSRRMLTEKKEYGELETGGTRLAFALSSFAASLTPVPHSEASLENPAPPIEIGLVTDDVESAYATALKAGAVEVKKPEKKPWGQTVGYVRDPNGFLVEICSPID